MKNSSVFYKCFYKFLRFFLIFVSFFCVCEIGFSTDFRWASYDSEGWFGIWSDVYEDSGKKITKHWEYSKILSNLLGWDKCDGDFPGYGSVTDPDVYFTAENESYATLTADCTNELKNLFISDRKNSNEAFGSEEVTINLNTHTLKTKNLVLGNSSFVIGDSVNFAVTGGGTLTVSEKMTFVAGCTYNIEIGADTVLDISDLTANVSGATINFYGKGTLKLGTATFSDCTVNFNLEKIEVSGATEISDSATVNFNKVSSVSFADKVQNSGAVNFSDCNVVKFNGALENSGTADFSGATATSVSGKITNSGTVELFGDDSSSINFPADFDNKGTICSSGLCSVNFASPVTDSGTWIYSGGTVKNQEISYNLLELNGKVVIPGDLTAKEIKIETESLNIQGKIKSDSIEINTEKAIVLDADVAINSNVVELSQNATFETSGKNLTFGSENDGSSIISGDKKNLVILDSASGGKTVFYSSLGISENVTAPLGEISSEAEISFNADVYADSIEAKNVVQISSAKITTSGGQIYDSALKITGTQTKLISENDGILFGGSVDISSVTLISVSAKSVDFSSNITVTGLGSIFLMADTIFSGNSIISLENRTFSVGNESNQKTVTVNANASAKFQNISAATFSGKIENSGNLSFSDCLSAKISSDLQNDGELEFSGATATSVSGKITNNGIITLNQTEKTEFSGGFENQPSGILLCNETAVNFPANFDNHGTVYSSGLCTVVFSADVTDSGTWIYSGGRVKNDDITYNILELNGTVIIPGDLTATKIIIKTESLNIQGEIKSDSIEINTENKIVLDENATINASSVSLLQNSTFDVNGKNLVLGINGKPCSVISSGKNLTFSDEKSAGSVTLNCKLGTATSPLGKISSESEISFNADVYSDSIEAKNAAQISSAKITTSGGQIYDSALKITGTQTKLISKNGGISFGGTVDISTETTIFANGSVQFDGIFTAISETSVEAESVVFASEVKSSALFDVAALKGDVHFLSAVNDSSGFSVKAANVQFDSDFVTSGAASILAETYFSGAAKDEIKIAAEKIVVGSENLEKNLYISALKDENSAKKIEWNAPFDVYGNLLLLNGDLLLGKNLSGDLPDIFVSKDIVLLNGNSSSMYDDEISAEFYWRSGAKNIFKYQGTADFPKEFPDGTEISSENFYSSLGGPGGNTISAGNNFYCNGVNLEGDSEWNLNAGDNGESENFAVAYNCSIKNCSYSSSGSGISYFAAAEATDGGGNNENVCFGHPEISLARTIYDDVVEVSFKDSISGESIKIENSNNEIWETFANSSKFLTYENDGKKISFAGTYVDAECSETTENQGDLEKFYLKATKTWNTDATGKSSGAAQSTDMNGNHRAAIPYLNLVRAVSDDFSGLFDEHKNRVANYDGEKRFVDVTDSCPPVLVAVRTGQELHEELPENQATYDSHNFLEFQYSEEIDILDGKIDSSALNVQSSENFGEMKNLSSENGFVVAGVVQFEKGKVSLGSESGLSAEKLNSLYRNFAVSATEGSSPQTHRFRISLAGYQSQSAAENSSGFPYWPGYIDSENTEIPAGKIVQLSTGGGNNENDSDAKFNDFIKDSEGNSLLVKSQKNHELQTLSVISNSSEDSLEPDWSDSLYGSWDLSAPVFAAYRPSRAEKVSSFYEILGACKTSGTVLERVEFHVFDNSDDFFENLGAEWYSHFGWGKNKSTLFSEDSYGSDVFGGSRPFGVYAGAASTKTSGGIRYSTLYNKSSYFKYGIDSETPSENFEDSTIKSGASSSLFLPQVGSKHEISSNDSLYFSIFLKDGTNLPLKTNFSIKYDEKACVTDLAGNLMKSSQVKSVDRVSPRFNMTSAKISGNKIYIVFNKKIQLEPVELESSDGTVQSFGIADSLRFIKIPEDGHKFEEADVVSDLYIEKGISPQETYSSETFTGLIFTLNRNVTLEDVKNYYIQCFSPDSGKFVDPFTGINGVKVTSITDINGIYMEHGEAHALSDFAVNVVNPVYAYDDRFLDENFGFSVSDAKESNISVHDWNQEQQNDGTLITEHDIFVVTSQDSGNSGVADTLPEKIIMYYDNAPDTDSISSEYNKNLEENLRVWIPSFVPYGEDSNSSVENVSPISALAPFTNAKNLFVAGEIDKSIAKFVLDWETLNKNGYSSGNQISFLFGLADSEGLPVKICHAPSYDEISGIYKIEKQPLFALRLKNSEDPTSLDLWSFKLKNVTLQRGNVTIFNNVIDANRGEMSVVQVNMPSEGNLDVIVMTLDGNIIRYLQHGTASAGEHNYSWNGTTKSGKKVARGLYFVRVFGNGIDETRKIMVVKN